MKKVFLIIMVSIISWVSLSKADFILNRDIIEYWKILYCSIGEIDDWDTFDLLCGNQYITNVRLLWVNAPDIEWPNWYKHCYYDETKNSINTIRKRELKVEFFWNDLCLDQSKWCRNLVIITDIASWLDLNELLISKWLAFSWTNFSSIPNELKIKYIKAEYKASRNKLWLWWKCRVEYNSNVSIDSWKPGKMTEILF